MADLKEHIVYGELSERTDFSPLQQQLPQTQPSELKRQFMRPFPNPPTPQQRPTLPEAQVPAKRQFILPYMPSELPQLSPTPDTPSELPQLSLATPPTPDTPSELPQQLPPTPPTPLPKLKLKKQKKSKTKMTRGKRIRRWFAVCSILTVIAVIFFSQANGVAGAWAADTMRSVLGPTLTAQIESWYLGLSDTTHQLQYNLGGSHVNAPWAVSTVTPLATATIPANVVRLAPMPLGHLSPLVTPALDGEGTWLTQEMAAAPYNYLPLDAKTFIRPDPSHPYAVVTLLQFDMRFFRLHMVAGTIEPGGPRGFHGPGVIPASDQKGNTLLAAFNGGFKYADGQYGLKVNTTVYVPPQPGAATLAVTREGQIILGAWGVDPRLNSGNSRLIAWRQNASLLINNRTINPLTQDGAAWGGTILNSAYTWRSGIGITTHGTLIYAAGASLTAQTLGIALHAVGAVMAMQTDINPFWVRAFLYSRDVHSNLNITKLNPAMYGSGTEYLSGTERDFFYLTRFTPPPPSLQPVSRSTSQSHETTAQ